MFIRELTIARKQHGGAIPHFQRDLGCILRPGQAVTGITVPEAVVGPRRDAVLFCKLYGALVVPYFEQAALGAVVRA